MKRFKRYLSSTWLVIFLLLTHAAPAFSQDNNSGQLADSIEISLLTCGPRSNVYSLYGHTAIRYEDKAHGTDLAVNYGVFSFDKPFFILRFVFGLTDYEMGIEYFSDFIAQYSSSGCGVRQQTLNLTRKEKLDIAAAIEKNYEPQNRVYRYNYFYDNCTSRARDIIVSHINGKVEYPKHKSEDTTFREMIHQYNKEHRWARFGNDLLLGVKADRPTTFEEQQFLPENLANDFANATVSSNGKPSKRKLVKTDTWVLPKTNGTGSDSFPVSPAVCLGAFAAVTLLLTAIERRKKKNFWIFDTLVMLADGTCGIILLAMIFSQHPTVNLNLQILLLNAYHCANSQSLKKRKGKHVA